MHGRRPRGEGIRAACEAADARLALPGAHRGRGLDERASRAPRTGWARSASSSPTGPPIMRTARAAVAGRTPALRLPAAIDAADLVISCTGATGAVIPRRLVSGRGASRRSSCSTLALPAMSTTPRRPARRQPDRPGGDRRRRRWRTGHRAGHATMSPRSGIVAEEVAARASAARAASVNLPWWPCGRRRPGGGRELAGWPAAEWPGPPRAGRDRPDAAPGRGQAAARADRPGQELASSPGATSTGGAAGAFDLDPKAIQAVTCVELEAPE